MSPEGPLVPVDAGPKGRRGAGLNRSRAKRSAAPDWQENLLREEPQSGGEVFLNGRFQGPTGVVQVTRHETGTRGSERIRWKRMNRRWPTFRKAKRDPKTGRFFLARFNQ
ncbi:hypothetical protein PB2503_05607 [Parvularcula bermudensis HTCC2503]|uniref:Uncharacterized protein n=1 Tax=Parvularcula bermudensis (strain ATCC BAA-594 / HTCC2503 / KCTC 12087) TaxID=314260 RepID=E0TGF1_PARBH|nr:hypothetical protein PB2503_05607 [Parvularcula bermudensis HTCC2503]